jgi:tRNA nucleotidyltransferase/poly(A) polymerase
MRCAGGWVRDKLMGRESIDIDIALDDMLGKQFADHVNSYLKAHGQETHHVAVIMSNPEQSKHLETARMRVRGLWIDLVNLRSEEYAHHSRIPTMEFGTPEEDAFRRDFTINAMFYNINQGIVEDFTGKGLEDLRSGIIRTPLPAKETFMDDPLRVLRAVRFSSRFGFELEESLLTAAGDAEVREMLGHKVSRERIGTELDGMLNGPDPVAAVDVLRRLRLFEAVFEVHPSATADVTDEFAAAGTALLTASYDILAAWNEKNEKEEEKVSLEDRRLLLLSALLLPLRRCTVLGTKGRPQSMAAHVIRDSLKWKTKDVELVDTMHSVAPRLLEVHRQLGSSGGCSNGGSSNENSAAVDVRIALGRCIRDLKSLWKLGTILAALLPAPEARPLGVDAAEAAAGIAEAAVAETELGSPLNNSAGGTDGGSGGSSSSSASREYVVNARLEVCKELVAAAEAFGIADCWQWKPLLDGKQVMAAVGMKQGGPALGKLMDKVVDWQLGNPKGTKDECEAWLKANWEEFVAVAEKTE